jgi:hypothetical protein
MLPAVAVRQFVPRYARIIDANDDAPPSHGIRATVNTFARRGIDARRFAAPSNVARREHDLQVVCPMQELSRGLQHTKATRALRDMKIGWRNTRRRRCQGLGDDRGMQGAAACPDRLGALPAAVTWNEAKLPLRRRVRQYKVNTGSGKHLIGLARPGDTGHHRRNRYGRRQSYGKSDAAEPSGSKQRAPPPRGRNGPRIRAKGRARMTPAGTLSVIVNAPAALLRQLKKSSASPLLIRINVSYAWRGRTVSRPLVAALRVADQVPLNLTTAGEALQAALCSLFSDRRSC